MSERFLRVACGAGVLVVLCVFAGCSDIRLAPCVAPVEIGEPPCERIRVVVSEDDPFYIHEAGNGCYFPAHRSYRSRVGEALSRACADAFRRAAVQVVERRSLATGPGATAPGPVVRPKVNTLTWQEKGKRAHFELSVSMVVIDPAGEPVARAESSRRVSEDKRWLEYSFPDLFARRTVARAGNRAMAEVVRECAERLLRYPRVLALWDYPVR